MQKFSIGWGRGEGPSWCLILACFIWKNKLKLFMGSLPCWITSQWTYLFSLWSCIKYILYIFYKTFWFVGNVSLWEAISSSHFINWNNHWNKAWKQFHLFVWTRLFHLCHSWKARHKTGVKIEPSLNSEMWWPLSVNTVISGRY